MSCEQHRTSTHRGRAKPGLQAARCAIRCWRLVRVLIVAIMLGALGCASEEEYLERPVAELYNPAAEALDAGNHDYAITLFQEVERQHPYSQWATQSQLMIAYAHYQGLEYSEAIAVLDRFIELHPGNAQIAYAYYLRAMCYYEQIVDVGRDQGAATAALEHLEEVVRRFPQTSYAHDAYFKLPLVRENLAGKEMEIGRFYLWREQYPAAILRFQSVVEDFQSTSHVPEALHRLIESYWALGLTGEAQVTLAVLELNFSQSPWYQRGYTLINGQAPPDRSQDSSDLDEAAPTDSTSKDETPFLRWLLQQLFSYIL